MSFRWLLQVYTRDVWSRLPHFCATATSVYGKFLKIYSIKKVCRKLAGAAARTATWVTNVDNKRGSTDIGGERFKGTASTETNARWLNEEVSGFSYHKSSLY